MGERKVLNKYFPPDFDPLLVPRKKKPKNMQIEVRMMLPFSIQCENCGEYMYRGKKFNSRKEDVQDEDYLGMLIFRFYIKCSVCNAEITFKTDPKNSDYTMEHGASRNFEAWRVNEEAEKEVEQEREQEEEGDSMKTLENRTLDSKIEMDILDALDEMKAINQRHERVDTQRLLKEIDQKNATKQATLEQEDEQLLKSIKFGNGPTVKRLDDSGSSDEEKPTFKSEIPPVNLLSVAAAEAAAERKKEIQPKKTSIVFKKKPLKKKKRNVDEDKTSIVKKVKAASGSGDSSSSSSSSSSTTNAAPLGGLLGAYGSGSSSD